LCTFFIANVPIMLYNIPGRTGINMLPETVVRLSKIDNIVALKEASGNMDQVSRLKQVLDDSFCIYSGDDSLTLPMLALGCNGVVSVAAHFVGNEIRDMIDTFQTGNIAAAAKMHKALYPAFTKIFITANPIPIKYCVSRLGFDCGPCRLPLISLNDEQKAILDQMLAEVDAKAINLA